MKLHQFLQMKQQSIDIGRNDQQNYSFTSKPHHEPYLYASMDYDKPHLKRKIRFEAQLPYLHNQRYLADHLQVAMQGFQQEQSPYQVLVSQKKNLISKSLEHFKHGKKQDEVAMIDDISFQKENGAVPTPKPNKKLQKKD